MTEEIYPMPSFPMLIVKDLVASSTWYQEALGFKHIFTMLGPGGTPGLVHLRWVKYADLLIARLRDENVWPESRGAGISLYFNLLDRFGGDIEAFAKQAKEKGAAASGPLDQPWNVREVTVLDPDGYRLIFTVPINTGLGLDKLLGRISNTMTG